MIHLAVVCDFVEENFLSMDLVAERLIHHLQIEHHASINPDKLCPPMRTRMRKVPGLNSTKFAFKFERLVNRFHDYPRWLQGRQRHYDLFHLVDHSYAQLVHQLPPDRTIVTCHDLDTFRSVLEPQREQRSSLFRAMTRRILDGLRKAALITCDSTATRAELLAHGITSAERAVVVHNGVHPSCSPQADPASDKKIANLIGTSTLDSIEILHVGSTIPRKRIDVLLRVLAKVKVEIPRIRLLRAGGPLTQEQTRLAISLGVAENILTLPTLDRSSLAALYRRAVLVLQPSEREGFGLPVVEAMACGVPVIASDIDALREVGGKAVSYCPVGDETAWSRTICELLHEREAQPERWEKRRQTSLAQSALFSWSQYTGTMVGLYRGLVRA